MHTARTKLSKDGSIVIPAEYLETPGLQVGDEVILRLEDGEMCISTIRQTVKRTQTLVRRYVAQGRSLSEELIAERRSEH
jgi:bifunctional DNA-binding transcriptional regulator/antitoxin component of YhaV-PrlF toxin-antitoxin module